MDSERSVIQMTNDEVLTLFGTATDLARRGFDEKMLARVWAYEFVRARARIAHYRALYTSFVEGGMHYMIERLNEEGSDSAVPAKLIFTDDPDDLFEVEESDEVIVWTEHALLDELANQRAILDFFGGVLDEYQAAVRT